MKWFHLILKFRWQKQSINQIKPKCSNFPQIVLYFSIYFKIIKIEACFNQITRFIVKKKVLIFYWKIVYILFIFLCTKILKFCSYCAHYESIMLFIMVTCKVYYCYKYYSHVLSSPWVLSLKYIILKKPNESSFVITQNLLIFGSFFAQFELYFLFCLEIEKLMY